MTITIPGTVSIRWRETNRWREMTLAPEWEPQTRQERVLYNARRMVWQGAPLVEAYSQAEHEVDLFSCQRA